MTFPESLLLFLPSFFPVFTSLLCDRLWDHQHRCGTTYSEMGHPYQSSIKEIHHRLA